MRGGCKRIGALAHAPQAFFHNVHAVSSIPVFPPCHDSDPAILPLLGLQPGSALSSAVLMAAADPDAPRVRWSGAGEVSCLEGALDKAGVMGGAPCSIRPILASPFLCLLVLPWQLYGRFQVAWSLFSCIFQLAQLCRGKGRKGESASGPDLPPGVHHLHLLGGEGMKCPSLALPWWKWEWAVHPSFSLGEDNADSVTLPQPGEAGLPPYT